MGAHSPGGVYLWRSEHSSRASWQRVPPAHLHASCLPVYPSTSCSWICPPHAPGFACTCTPAGAEPSSRASCVVRRLEWASLLAFRVLPHGAATLIVAACPRAFRHTGYYTLALLGMVCMNYMNAMKVSKASSTAGAVATKPHAA